MTITLLDYNTFEEIDGVKKDFHCGWGRGRNATHIKKDSNGNLYAKLSPIADIATYDGYVQEVKGEYVTKALEHFLNS